MSLLSGLADLIGSSTAFFLLVLAWYVTSAVYSWYRLRHVPGPFLASFSYLWLAYYALSGKQLEIIDYIGKKYGSLIRLGPNVLLSDDPEVIKSLSSAKSKYKKSTWYLGSRFNPYHTTMFITLDPIAHDKTKAQVWPGYSGRDNPNYESDIDSQISNFVSIIRKRYITIAGVGGYRPLNLAQTVSYFTIDVISKLSIGQEFGCLETETDRHGFIETTHKQLLLIAIAQDVPLVRNIAYSTLGLKIWGPKETDKKGLGRIMHIANEAVRKHFKPDADKDDKAVLASFMRHGLTQPQCEVESIFMFVAGSDTTASAIRATLLHIFSIPRVYQRLKDEIRSAVVEGGVSHPITQAEARELPYLQGVIYEGLRIRPVTTAMIAKEVPPEGDTINGKFIPGGMIVGSNFQSLLRSKVLFGEDSDMFRPERFLELDQKARAEMERNVELSFGYGRWMCAGKPIAFMELNKIFFELLRNFDFQLVNPQKPMTTASYGLYIDEGLVVRVTESDIAH
ncbi:cytochrome P450 [Annulohypoxylon maeteangense]|uniref:cytochrome P450 n=1 Tax=Annulohypoxylon maeteangense TaxID=1927788 RepID=UPI0020078329|nr:cytochrome P450 [Annulohypoxylon maeteangense]KAI0888215.1 cytochrome P450 [Annulohypoxylon maeteangense]